MGTPQCLAALHSPDVCCVASNAGPPGQGRGRAASTRGPRVLGITIGEQIAYLMPRLKRNKSAPAWPPDMFAICVSLLHKSGSYCTVLEKWPPYSSWTTEIAKLGQIWRKAWKSGPPDEIRQK